jgi:hypothetical protein
MARILRWLRGESSQTEQNSGQDFLEVREEVDKQEMQRRIDDAQARLSRLEWQAEVATRRRESAASDKGAQ